MAAVVLNADRRAGSGDVHTLLLGPVLYTIFVIDLKILKWETRHKGARS
jgi:hypothetical protein